MENIEPKMSVSEIPLNVDQSQPPAQTTLLIPKSKRTWKVSAVGKAFVGFVVTEIICLIGLFISMLNSTDDSDTIYTAISSIATTLGFLYFALDSILLENIFQFAVSIVCHILISIYAVYNYYYGNMPNDTIRLMSMCIAIGTWCMQLIYFGLAYFVKESFGWRLYKRVGGNSALQANYQTSQIFFSLLKLDFLLAVLLELLASFFLYDSQVELVGNIIAILLSFLWIFFGYFGVRGENVKLMYAFAVFAIAEPVYIIVKFVDFNEDHSQKTSYTQFFTTGSIALLVRILLLFWAYWSFTNFGQGLRTQVFTRRQTTNVLEKVKSYAEPLFS